MARDGPTMATGSMVSGTLGGALGIGVAGLAFALGSLGAADRAEDGVAALVPAVVILLVALLGVAGGAVARTAPGWSAAMQGVAALAGTPVARAFWILPGLLLLVGAGLALAVARGRRAPPDD